MNQTASKKKRKKKKEVTWHVSITRFCNKVFFKKTTKGQTSQTVETESAARVKTWLKCKCWSRTWRWSESPEGNCQHFCESKEETPVKGEFYRAKTKLNNTTMWSYNSVWCNQVCLVNLRCTVLKKNTSRKAPPDSRRLVSVRQHRRMQQI